MVASSIVDQIYVIKEFTRFFSDEEGVTITSWITLKEVKMALNGFARSKRAGPYGWTVELFLEFFDIMGPNILATMEESIMYDKVSGAMNSTFNVLI